MIKNVFKVTKELSAFQHHIKVATVYGSWNVAVVESFTINIYYIFMFMFYYTFIIYLLYVYIFMYIILLNFAIYFCFHIIWL